jgi:outer membrane protein assembly factor BamB
MIDINSHKYCYPVFLAIMILGANGATPEWPEWRGPGGLGHADAKNLPTNWNETRNVTWKISIPGNGHSSPVINGNQIWLTTGFETPEDPQKIKQRLKVNTGGQPLNLLAKVKLHAICVDRLKGKILHNIKLFEVKEPQWVHKLNSYASPTPVIEGERLYCHFGTFGSACIDTTFGKVLWKNEELQVMHENGPGSSPILHGNHLILHCDGSDKQFVAALDKRTGKVAWKTKRSGTMHSKPQLKKAYGTPLLVDMNGRPTVVSTGANWLYGYDPSNGRELWKLSYGLLGFSNVSRPVAGNGTLYFSTCFMKGNLLAVKYEGLPKPEIQWSFTKGAPKMPSPILVGNELYYVTDNGIANCLDAGTGEAVWRERVGGEYSASPIHADGKLYFPSQYGTTLVLKPGRKFTKLAENKLEGRHMASIAVAGDTLFIRTDKALYRIEGS